MIHEFFVTVPAPAGEEERRAYVYLPRGYDGIRRFPVLYLFDGQTAFYDHRAPYGESLRLGEYLDAHNVPVIAAAVECDAKNRLTEYSPFPFRSEYGDSEGKGENYMRWLTGAFKPYIDERYATLPQRENTYVAGSSMGGLMSLYALSCFSGTFIGAAALSPSLWGDPAYCERLLCTLPKDARIYLDYGERELGNHKRQRDALKRAAAALMESGASFTFRIVRGGTHSERSWRAQIPVFLRCLGLQD